MNITTEVLVDLHLRMVRIRSFEEAAARLLEDGELPGFVHLSVGQEAVAAGVCAALSSGDQIASTHRGHGHLIARGGEMNRMMAELMGKATGYCSGKGGSMHLSDFELGMLGSNGIVGAGAPIAVGAAFANAYRGNDSVAVAFFGDGASNTGALHEAANVAAALRLPVVFVCETNDATMAIGDVADRAGGYGMPGVVVDGMDVVAMFEAARAGVERARNQMGPSLIEAKTYRFFNHRGAQARGGDHGDERAVQHWQARDPVFTFETRLQDADVLRQVEIDDVWANVRSEVDAAVRFARESPFPAVAAAHTDVYTVAETEAV